MAIDLSLDTLPEMKIAEYVKAFKNKALWKKAKYVLVLMDYKLDGKRATVAIPFKKRNQAKEAFKKIKKEKLHFLKKTGIGSFELGAGESGPEATINFTYGGLNPEAVMTKASKLFDKIKLSILFAGGQAEAVEGEEDTDDDDAPEVDMDAADVEDGTEEGAEVGEGEEDSDDQPEAEMGENLAAALKAQFQQLKNDFGKFKSEIIAKVKDKTLTDADKQFISDLNKAVNAFAEAVVGAPAALKAKLQEALDKFKAQQPTLQKILQKFGAAVKEKTNISLDDAKVRLEQIKARIAEIRAELAV